MRASCPSCGKPHPNSTQDRTENVIRFKCRGCGHEWEWDYEEFLRDLGWDDETIDDTTIM